MAHWNLRAWTSPLRMAKRRLDSSISRAVLTLKRGSFLHPVCLQTQAITSPGNMKTMTQDACLDYMSMSSCCSLVKSVHTVLIHQQQRVSFEMDLQNRLGKE